MPNYTEMLFAAIILSVAISAAGAPPPITTFPASYPAGDAPGHSQIVDLNSDGHQDLAVVNHVGNSVSVFLGSSSGALTPHQQIPTGYYPELVSFADFNSDSMLDMVITCDTATTVAVMLGSGDGSFGTPMDFALEAPLEYGGWHSATTGDFNGDSNADILVLSSPAIAVPDLQVENFTLPDGYLSFLFGNGAGGFAPPLVFTVQGGGDAPKVADLNGDGIDDVAFRMVWFPKAVVLLGGSDMQQDDLIQYDTGWGPVDLSISKVNDDNFPDLAVVHWSDPVGIHLGNGDGTFQPRYQLAADTAGMGISPGDFNGDGRTDFGITQHERVIALIADKEGFTSQTLYARPATYFRRLATGDLNADGLTDLVLPISAHHSIEVVLNTTRAADLTGIVTLQHGRFGRTGSWVRGKILVNNIGSLPSVPSTLQTQLSADGLLDNLDPHHSNIKIGAFRPGQTQIKNTRVRLPRGTRTTSTTLFATVDSTDAVSEMNEFNNTAHSN